MVPTFKSVSDFAVLIELGNQVDDDINRSIIELDRVISNSNIDGLVEVVPAMVNLLIIFDPLITDHHKMTKMISTFFPLGSTKNEGGQKHIIEVCYESELGVDLHDVAKTSGMSVESVISTHINSSYRVSMYGFAPGYAYLSGVQSSLQIPRKVTPVRDVPAGSVLIAGPQCLVSTLKMPTGWSIIGRTNAQIITGNEDKPFLFNVGDTVIFQRVSIDDFKGNSDE